MMTVRATVICLVLWVAVAVLSNGCLAPSFIFPKTGGYGVVLDQDGRPLTNATMKALWLPGRLIPFIADGESANFPIRSDGTWEFYKRKVEFLSINAYAPKGYEPWMLSVDHLYQGHCVSNVVFQFHKAQAAQSPKEQK